MVSFAMMLLYSVQICNNSLSTFELECVARPKKVTVSFFIVFLWIKLMDLHETMEY